MSRTTALVSGREHTSCGINAVKNDGTRGPMSLTQSTKPVQSIGELSNGYSEPNPHPVSYVTWG